MAREEIDLLMERIESNEAQIGELIAYLRTNPELHPDERKAKWGCWDALEEETTRLRDRRDELLWMTRRTP